MYFIYNFNDVLTYLIQGKSKSARKRNERLGFISTIHTFGRDMKHNPHVSRYAGHPAMSESRILKYDKKIKMVYYYYDPHEDDAIINEDDKIGRQYVTESVFDFIKKLIVHIPQERVHITRYYGFYANHSSLDIRHQPKLFKMVEIKEMNKKLSWRERLLSSYKYDPLLCHCGATMVIVPDLCFFTDYSKEDG